VTMAALSLAISYDPAVVAFDSVTSSVDGISVASNVVGSELRLGWFDYIGMTPVQMTAGNLTTLCFRSLLDPGESGVSTLDFTVLSMLGDTMGDRIWNATFDDGRIIIGEPSSGVGDATRRPARITGNYPNPFNPSTTVMFGVDEAGPVSVAVFDVAGRRVRGLVSDVRYEAGEHAVAWDGRDDAGRAVPSGIYFCRLVTGTGTDTGKLVLQK